MIMLEFPETMARARRGEGEALGALLEPYRNYLRFLAAAQMGRQIGLRVTPSDIVQDTMLAAHRDFGNFVGTSSAEFSNWLRTIMARALLKAIEHHLKAEKRDVRRELSLDQIQRNFASSCNLAASLVSNRQPSPSHAAVADEEAKWLADLISRLPEDYQQVIALRNFGGLRFEEVASKMQRSTQAVRMLWLRAISRLRELIPADSSR
jgi:RNA polymerase sigma-70 factor, ECF subfamily